MMLNNKNGFSLLEILIAVAVILVGVMAFINLQVVVMRGSSFGYEMTLATTEANNILEQLMRLPLQNSRGQNDCIFRDTGAEEPDYTIGVGLDNRCDTLGCTYCTDVELPISKSADFGNKISFTAINYSVMDVNSSTTPAPKIITVILNWTDKSGRAVPVRLSTIKTGPLMP